MEIRVRNIKLIITTSDGTEVEITKPVMGGDEMVIWAAEQYAEVNSARVKAFDGDYLIFDSHPTQPKG